MGFETKTIRIAMNGITGRMGYRQHLLRSILPIRDAGGFTLEDGTKVQVEPILVGRREPLRTDHTAADIAHQAARRYAQIDSDILRHGTSSAFRTASPNAHCPGRRGGPPS